MGLHLLPILREKNLPGLVRERGGGDAVSLNIAKGNMYPWITHTWNTVKGACPHGCSYCYMKRWGKQRPAYFDKREMKTDLGEGNFIFVGSSCDMFAADIPEAWIGQTLRKCWDSNNKYLFQTKNPKRLMGLDGMEIMLPYHSTVCTTIETNRVYPEIMQRSPTPENRVIYLSVLSKALPRFVTIEPIMDFDLEPLVELVRRCEPEQVNIGADSGGHHLPEPSRGQVEALIGELGKFTRVERKANLARLAPPAV
jgi:DNA repair photolyase